MPPRLDKVRSPARLLLAYGSTGLQETRTVNEFFPPLCNGDLYGQAYTASGHCGRTAKRSDALEGKTPTRAPTDFMDTVFSTDDVHPRDRFDYWHDVACKTIIEHDSRAEHPARFAAHIRAASLGTSEVVLFGNSPMTVRHATKHLSHTRDDQIFLCQQVAGELALEHEARDCRLTPGALTLLDPRLPYEGTFSGGSELLVWKFPRRELEARMGPTRDLVGRSLTPVDGRSSFLAAHLSLVSDHIGNIPFSGTGQIESQMLDLTALVFANGLRREGNSSRSRTLVCLNVRAAIEAHLANPDLDAATVAAAVGVSVRYANLALAEEQTSISRLILERRLERCRIALADPAQLHRSVSEIAYGWGFSDMTHFGRRFKRAYGVLPRDYRKMQDLGVSSEIGPSKRKGWQSAN